MPDFYMVNAQRVKMVGDRPETETKTRYFTPLENQSILRVTRKVNGKGNIALIGIYNEFRVTRVSIRDTPVSRKNVRLKKKQNKTMKS